MLENSVKKLKSGNKNSNNRIKSLDSLRSIASLGIFLSHAGSTIKWSALGVSIFYVMSGFLLYRIYARNDIEVNIKERISFSKIRISKLYTLHIVTMCSAIILEILMWLRHGGQNQQ